MERIVRKSAGTYPLTATAYDADGAKVAISGTVTVTVYDGAGTSIETGTPTITDGTLVYAMPNADLTNLDTYKATWTGTVASAAQSWDTYFELVGGYYFEISELRAGDGITTLASTVTYPTATLESRRAAVELTIEAAARVAFVPRGHRHTVRANGDIWLPHRRIRSIYSITVDGTALTATELAAVEYDKRLGRIWDGPWTDGCEVVVHYEHGYDACPEPIKEGALKFAIERSVASALPARARGVSTESGYMSYTLADGGDNPTGLPDLDAQIKLFREGPLVG